MQKIRNENEYINLINFHFTFRYKKSDIMIKEFFNELDKFYYIGIYSMIDNEMNFIKKFDTYRYFLQNLKFENKEKCLMYCEETKKLIKNGIIKTL